MRLVKIQLSCLLLLSFCCCRVESTPQLPIPLYLGPSSFVVETAFVTRVVLASIPATCRQHLVIRQRGDFALDAPSNAVLVITFDISEAEWHVVKRSNIVVLHLSTEYSPDNTQFYSDALVVFRQYWTEAIELRMPGDRGAIQQTTWMPLGYGRFEPLPALNGPLRYRKNHWTWMGSVGMNRPQRPRMVQGLQAARPYLLSLGKLLVFEDFAGAEAMLPLEYSATLYDSVFLPIPSGHSAEQYRIWEAFEAGCIPIFLSGQMSPGSVLAPIRALNFSFLEVQDWLDLPQLLGRLSRYREQNPSLQKYQEMASHSHKVWTDVKLNLSEHFAKAIEYFFP